MIKLFNKNKTQKDQLRKQKHKTKDNYLFQTVRVWVFFQFKCLLYGSG